MISKSRMDRSSLCEEDIDVDRKGYLNIDDFARFVNLHTSNVFTVKDC
jgi:hypothetical protein